MRTSFCSADCTNCIKVANERALKETHNPFAEKINMFSRPGVGFGGDVSKSIFGGIIYSSSNTGTTTTANAHPKPNPNPNPKPNPNPNEGGFGDKSSVVFRESVPSNFLATSSWTHSSVFGPSKTTASFDYSATPINSFKFPPASNDTTASVFKPTTQPQPHEVCGHKQSGAYSGTVSPYEGGNGIITSISAMPVYADKSHEQLRFQHYQLQGTPAPAPAPTVDQFSKLTIFAQPQPQPQPQLTLPIFVLTMMGSSIGFTQIGTLPAKPLTNGSGITISGSPTFGSPIISGSPTFGSPATIASFGTEPPSSGSSPTLLFGVPATTALSFPQNAAYGDN